MKKILFSLSAVFSVALFSPLSLSADLVLPAPAAESGVVQASHDLLAQSPAAQAPLLQMAAIGDTGGLRDAGLTDVKSEAKAAAEGLPSTPVALATLLLVICILVGRRNA